MLPGRQYGLRNPAALAVGGGILWVANSLGNSVTEINASTGTLIRVLSGREYHFQDPSGIAASGSTAWVTNMGRQLRHPPARPVTRSVRPHRRWITGARGRRAAAGS